MYPMHVFHKSIKEYLVYDELLLKIVYTESDEMFYQEIKI